MLLLKPIKLSVFLFLAVACNNKTSSDATAKSLTISPAIINFIKDTFPAGKIIDTVVCKTNPAQSYALYIPAKTNNDKPAVIYFFDAHADGALPVKKYKTLADKYNFILIGSNNSKNGNDWPTSENIWQNLFSDTQARLAVNISRIYTCGFSGGAKVAGYIALNHKEIKGVIASGAGLPDEARPDNFNFSFTGITGKGDMNMTDLITANNEFDKTQTTHRILFFDGKHAWAPVNTMNIAFEGLQFDAMRENLVAKNDALINNYIDSSKKRMDADMRSTNFIAAINECTVSENMLAGLTGATDFFKQKITSIKNNSVYQKQLAVQKNLFETEQTKKEEYNRQFQINDINYWNTTIADLNTKANAHTEEGAMYQRLLAYLSLAFYSISNQLINGGENEQGRYFVDLYKVADPENTEAWYFSAILDARKNNAAATQNDLQKAVNLGFNDKQRMLQQPEFKSVLTQQNLNTVIADMKNDIE